MTACDASLRLHLNPGNLMNGVWAQIIGQSAHTLLRSSMESIVLLARLRCIRRAAHRKWIGRAIWVSLDRVSFTRSALAAACDYIVNCRRMECIKSSLYTDSVSGLTEVTFSKRSRKAWWGRVHQAWIHWNSPRQLIVSALQKRPRPIVFRQLLNSDCFSLGML